MNSRSGTAPTSTPKRILSRFRDKPTSRRVTRQLHVAQDSVFRVRARYIKCSARQRRFLAYCTFREASASLNETHPRVKVQQPPRARR